MFKKLITVCTIGCISALSSYADEIEVFEKKSASDLTFPNGKYQYNSGMAQMTTGGKTFVIPHRSKKDTSAIINLKYNLEEKSMALAMFDTVIEMKPISADAKNWSWNNSLPSIKGKDKEIFDALKAALASNPEIALDITKKISGQMEDAQKSKGLSDVDLSILAGVKDLSELPRWIGNKKIAQGNITVQLVQLTDDILRGQIVFKGDRGVSRQNFSLVRK